MSVIVTVVVTVAAVAVHVVTKLAGVRSTTVGVAGIVPPVQVGKATVIVPAAARLPWPLLVVKPIVQCPLAPAASDVAVAVTTLTLLGSMTYGSGRPASSSGSSRRQPSEAFRSDQRRPAGVMSLPDRS